LSNTQILYAGQCSPAALTICIHDLSNGSEQEFSGNIDTSGSSINDEPVVFGNTLFYRHIDGAGVDRRLRFIELTGICPIPQPPQPPCTVGTTSPANVDVTDGANPFSTNVDYYTVSYNGLRSIGYYDGVNGGNSGCNFTYLYYNPYLQGNNPSDPPTWTNFTNSTQHWVDNQWCNPYYSGNPNNWSDLWAFRNTQSWNP
jgi:hypothetical protein